MNKVSKAVAVEMPHAEPRDVSFAFDPHRVYLDSGSNGEIILVVRDVVVEDIPFPILSEEIKEWMLERDMGALHDEILDLAIGKIVTKQTAGIFAEIAKPVI